MIACRADAVPGSLRSLDTVRPSRSGMAIGPPKTMRIPGNRTACTGQDGFAPPRGTRDPTTTPDRIGAS